MNIEQKYLDELPRGICYYELDDCYVVSENLIKGSTAYYNKEVFSLEEAVNKFKIDNKYEY